MIPASALSASIVVNNWDSRSLKSLTSLCKLLM